MSLSGQSTTTATLNILDLNDDAFLSILSWLSFDDLAKIRLVTKYDFSHHNTFFILLLILFVLQVCRRFNSTCQTLLNKGFAAVKLYNTKCQKEIKLLLPRRDSERRVHMLTKHLGVLTGTSLHFFLYIIYISSILIFYLYCRNGFILYYCGLYVPKPESYHRR